MLLPLLLDLLVHGRYYTCYFSTNLKIDRRYPRSCFEHQNSPCRLGGTTNLHPDLGQRLGDREVRQVALFFSYSAKLDPETDATGISAPRSACRELVLSIVQDLPASMIDQYTLSKVNFLLNGYR
jgi:hypothetical protein